VSRRREEELESDSDAGGAVDFDEDLKGSEIDEAEMRERAEIEDDEDESPAEKRLRLAKLYLESVRNDLGARPCWVDAMRRLCIFSTVDGEWDAADIDREIIQARLQKDVVSSSHRREIMVQTLKPCPRSIARALGKGSLLHCREGNYTCTYSYGVLTKS